MSDVEVRADDAVEHLVNDAITRALTNHKATFFFERTVKWGDYNGQAAKSGISIQFDYEPDVDAEEWLVLAREAAFRGMAFVYETLGIEAHRDEGGTLREVVNAFPGATVEPQESSSPVVVTASVGPVPPYSKEKLAELSGDEKKAAQRENNEWAKARHASHPNEFWDNTQDKRYPNSHDFAHKTHKGVGYWVT